MNVENRVNELLEALRIYKEMKEIATEQGDKKGLKRINKHIAWLKAEILRVIEEG